MGGELIVPSGLLAAVGAELAYDVCGASAKYLNGDTLAVAASGVENIKRIFEFARAFEKSDAAENQFVPPRVLRTVISEGFFCENDVEAAYLGGILASAKSPAQRDDRAVTYCSAISALSSYQIRTHYIIYSAILRARNVRFSMITEWMLHERGVSVCILESDYVRAMQFAPTEDQRAIGQHSFIGLEKQGLSQGGFRVVTDNRQNGIEMPFRYFYPTPLGAELFVWAHGSGPRGFDAFDPELLKRVSSEILVEPYDIKLGKVSWG